jgi:SAM-dependent methyltransferase
MKNRCNPDNIKLIVEDLSYLIDTNNNNIHNYFWLPNIIVNKMVENYCVKNSLTKVLEIGPGIVPFALSTDFIGCNEKMPNYINIDIDKDIFPYKDKTFDFVYCRHVLEDIQNPDFALKEILRVCKGGYIETPSPLIECTKNVDVYDNSNKYCGYNHHRYIVWSSIKKNEIYFLPKYSCILDHFVEMNDYKSYNIINNYPVYWNNYFIFNTTNQPKIIMYKQGVNFNMNSDNKPMFQEYYELIQRSINESVENTNYFIKLLTK